MNFTVFWNRTKVKPYYIYIPFMAYSTLKDSDYEFTQKYLIVEEYEINRIYVKLDPLEIETKF